MRTLHHYHEIGLLRPAFMGENRYRYYGREELLRLQDILFHRELGVPLQEIAKLLAREGRDRVEILTEHRAMLANRVERSRQLLNTIDRTIAELNGEGTVKDKDLYKGFAPEKQAEYEEWLVEHGGEPMRKSIEHSKAAFGKLSKEQIQANLEEGGRAEMALVELFKAGNAIDAPAVEPALDRHRALGFDHVEQGMPARLLWRPRRPLPRPTPTSSHATRRTAKVSPHWLTTRDEGLCCAAGLAIPACGRLPRH